MDYIEQKNILIQQCLYSGHIHVHGMLFNMFTLNDLFKLLHLKIIRNIDISIRCIEGFKINDTVCTIPNYHPRYKYKLAFFMAIFYYGHNMTLHCDDLAEFTQIGGEFHTLFNHYNMLAYPGINLILNLLGVDYGTPLLPDILIINNNETEMFT